MTDKTIDPEDEDNHVYGVLSIVLGGFFLFIALYNSNNFSKIDQNGNSNYIFYVFQVIVVILLIVSASMSLNRKSNIDIRHMILLSLLFLIPTWFVGNLLTVKSIVVKDRSVSYTNIKQQTQTQNAVNIQ
jgi:uncharacterized membrane protein